MLLLSRSQRLTPRIPSSRPRLQSISVPSSLITRPLYATPPTPETTTTAEADPSLPSPPPPVPRRPFSPRYRTSASSQGFFTSLYSYYHHARQPLLDLQTRSAILHGPAEVSDVEGRFSVLHQSVKSGLKLSSSSKPGRWREDVVDVVKDGLDLICGPDEGERRATKETLRLLLDGAWLSPTSGHVPSSLKLLRGTRTAKSLPVISVNSTRPFDELLRLVQLVLEIRRIEFEHHRSTPLDPTARSLLLAIDDHFRLLDTFRPPTGIDAEPVVVELPNGKKISTTPEQTDVVFSPSTPGVTVVKAHAGTGKTTSMLGFAQKLAEEGDAVRVIVRSRRLRRELKPLFPDGYGVDETCVTLNALVKRGFEQQYGKESVRKWKMGGGKGWGLRGLSHGDVMRLMKIGEYGWMVESTKEGRKKRIAGKRIAERLWKALDDFVASSDPVPSLSHVSFPTRLPVIPPTRLLPYLETLWSRISGMDDHPVPLRFNEQVKLRQIDPDYRISGDGPILVDEAQDLTPCELDLLVREATRRRVVLLGDPHQAIDGWRGANETWLTLRPDTDLTLRQTHRFTQDLSAVVNARLRNEGNKHNDFVLAKSRRGDGEQTAVYRSSVVDEHIGRIRLYPRYLALFLDLYDIISGPSPPSTIRILSSTVFKPKGLLQCCNHAWHLYNDRPLPNSYNPLFQPYYVLQQFPTWADFKKEVKSWGCDLPDPGAGTGFTAWHIALSLESCGALKREDFLEVVQQMEESLVDDSEEADLTLTIPHQCKGLEFDDVWISPTFHASPAAQPCNLLHVALTRAKKSVEITEPLLQAMASEVGIHNFEILPPTLSGVPSVCPSCKAVHSRQIDYHSPFPYHPSHSPPPVPSSPSSTDDSDDRNVDRLLEAAEDSYAALKPEHFPLCAGCASKSEYEPLRMTAEYATGASTAVRDAEKADGWGEEVDFEGYVEETMERECGLREKAADEVQLKRF